MEDYSYLGSGIVLIREHGTNAGFEELGNTSAFSISPTLSAACITRFGFTPGMFARSASGRPAKVMSSGSPAPKVRP